MRTLIQDSSTVTHGAAYDCDVDFDGDNKRKLTDDHGYLILDGDVPAGVAFDGLTFFYHTKGITHAFTNSMVDWATVLYFFNLEYAQLIESLNIETLSNLGVESFEKFLLFFSTYKEYSSDFKRLSK